MIKQMALVAGGGAIGAVARWLLAGWVLHRAAGGGPFPWGTLAVNLVGCLLAGLLAGAVVRGGGTTPPSDVQLFLMTGILGGFTTFSAFGVETVRLLTRGDIVAAALYVAASVIGGLGLLWLTMMAVLKYTSR